MVKQAILSSKDPIPLAPAGKQHYGEISEGYVEQVEQDPNHGHTLQGCQDVLPTHTTADAHEEAQHRLLQCYMQASKKNET